MEAAQLFPALDQGQVNMVASSLTDGRLTCPNIPFWKTITAYSLLIRHACWFARTH
jgi:hypothetical protein